MTKKSMLRDLPPWRSSAYHELMHERYCESVAYEKTIKWYMEYMEEQKGMTKMKEIYNEQGQRFETIEEAAETLENNLAHMVRSDILDYAEGRKEDYVPSIMYGDEEETEVVFQLDQDTVAYLLAKEQPRYFEMYEAVNPMRFRRINADSIKVTEAYNLSDNIIYYEWMNEKTYNEIINANNEPISFEKRFDDDQEEVLVIVIEASSIANNFERI